ncbi:MAG: cysteine desulfurase NifS [Methanospirillum sp.]|nr:cysteine desulfurase NifS [Methanospirillum sp.]
MNRKRLVYLDHAATTPTAPGVVEAMLPYFSGRFGNPSSIYGIARESRLAVDHAREQVARAINGSPEEVYLTSGGTEADNWAIKGVAFADRKRGDHIITSSIEHHAVLHTCQYLEKQGFRVTYLSVDEFGRVDPADLENAMTDRTVLVSIMAANNEIGTLEPIAACGEICRDHGVRFHTDAVQAIGSVPVDVEALNVDLLSLSAHKFYGPKGVGALYVRKGVRLDNLLHGGAQERHRRAGTENVPGIVGMGVAIERACERREDYARRLTALRDRLYGGITERIEHVRLNGHPTERLPGNLNLSFRFIEGESTLLMLDHAGICASSGSACTSGSLDPSYVLLAIGLPHEIAHGSLRFTLGESNTDDDVDYVLETLPPIVERLRTMSPLYAEYRRSQDVQ